MDPKRFAALLAGATVLACRAELPADAPVETKLIGAVRWYVDYDAALDVGRAENKALWVHFGEDPG